MAQELIEPLPAHGTPAAPGDGAGESLLCPLCTYDLRGLVEPRCPECGYRFTWDELRDPARRLHRYLFEHHAERNVWSLWRTFLGSLRPRRFWGELYPTQPSRPKRLLLYWLIVTAVSVVPYAAYLGQAVMEVDAYARKVRPTWWAGLTAADRGEFILQYGSQQAATDANVPLLPSPRVVHVALRWSAWPFQLPAMITLLWPWLTVGALMVFQASMRRAKVRPVHVLRCVIYSADACLVAAVLMAVTGAYSRWGSGAFGYEPTSVQWTFAITLGLMVFLTYRLWVAYRKYLRFDHALATVVASQVMVWLLVLKVALDLDVIR